MLVSDRQGLVQYASSAFERLCGCLRQAIEGRNLRLLGQELAFPDQLWMASTRGESWSSRFSGGGGQEASLELETSLSPVRNQDGQIANFVLVQRDVTKEARLEA
ncbi:hypothetical protein DFAR_1630010 [Desulfarculales bacterium]